MSYCFLETTKKNKKKKHILRPTETQFRYVMHPTCRCRRAFPATELFGTLPRGLWMLLGYHQGCWLICIFFEFQGIHELLVYDMFDQKWSLIYHDWYEFHPFPALSLYTGSWIGFSSSEIVIIPDEYWHNTIFHQATWVVRYPWKTHLFLWAIYTMAMGKSLVHGFGFHVYLLKMAQHHISSQHPYLFFTYPQQKSG